MTIPRLTQPCLLVALLALSVCPAASYASASYPALGTFTAKGKSSKETARFELRRTKSGGYAARTTVALVAKCSSDSEDSTRDIAAKNVTVKLKRAGGRLQGTRRYGYFDPDQADVVVRIGIAFTGTTRARVTLSASYGAEEQRDGSGTDSCTRKLQLTARHR